MRLLTTLPLLDDLPDLSTGFVLVGGLFSRLPDLARWGSACSNNTGLTYANLFPWLLEPQPPTSPGLSPGVRYAPGGIRTRHASRPQEVTS